MAITNAQQYQQLVNKPANGKRPGYRGPGGYQSGRSDPSSSRGVSPGGGNSRRSSSPSSSSSSNNNSGGSSDSPPQQFTLDANDRKIISGPGGREPTEIQKFIDNPPPDNKDGIRGLVPFYLRYAGKFNRVPNRKFLTEKVLRGKNASKIITDALGLDDDGLSYTVDQLDADQLEKVMASYMPKRLSGETDAYGNIIPPKDDNDNNQNIISDYERRLREMEQALAANPTATPVEEDQIINYRLMADGGMTNDAPVEGGIMDLESGRQMYFLGKLVKKATRAVKKIVKSPIGKLGLGALVFGGATGGFGASGFLRKTLLPKLYKDGAMTGLGKIALAGGLTAAPFLFGNEDTEKDQPLYAGPDIDDPRTIMNNPYDYINRRLVADGGIMRSNYAEGSEEPVAKKTMPLLDMDGKEMDLRADGGFVPIGRMERADDVPARLSKNEFVFTADAVRNAGEGDIDKGAEVMYNMMKNLESGGEVSEESQGLDGARDMFQTSQRLEEVL